MHRAIGFEEEHDEFRASVRAFLEKEAVPKREEWERAGVVDRQLFRRAHHQDLWRHDGDHEGDHRAQPRRDHGGVAAV